MTRRERMPEKKGSIASHANNYQLQDKIIQENIKKAYKAFHQLKSDPDRQDTWLAGIIRAQAMAKGTTTKTLWKQHRAAEKARNTARIVQLILKSTQRQGSLQVVIGPTPDGQWSEFSTKHSLEKACLEEAGRRFTQAKDTPLLQEHLLKRFGELGTNRPEFRKVLDGKPTHHPTDDIYVTKLLKQLQ